MKCYKIVFWCGIVCILASMVWGVYLQFAVSYDGGINVFMQRWNFFINYSVWPTLLTFLGCFLLCIGKFGGYYDQH